MRMYDLIVIGGGIAGLTAVYRANQLAPRWRIALLEASDRWGGKIATDYEQGLVIEAGPDCFLSRKPRGWGLAKELGLTSELQGRLPASQTAYVLRHGRLHPVPAGLTGMVPTNLDALYNSDLLSEEGTARVAQEAELSPAPANLGDESVAAFMRRRLGAEAFDNLIEPLMGGIYAGQAEQLSLAATFPQLRQLELTYGSLLGGLANRPPTPTSEPDLPPFVAFRDGMGRLVQRLGQRLDDSQPQVTRRLNTAVTALRNPRRGEWVAETETQKWSARRVILATPAFTTAVLLAKTAPDIASAHAAIPYANTALVNFAFHTATMPLLPTGYGYVIPQVEGRAALACTWSSQKWANRAPADQTLLRVYLGRYGQEDVTALPDEALVAMAKREIAETLNITAVPRFTRIYRWPNALPQYNLGHLDLLTQIESNLRQHPGLYLAGAAYRGVGIPDCIASGEMAATQAATLLP